MIERLAILLSGKIHTVFFFCEMPVIKGRFNVENMVEGNTDSTADFFCSGETCEVKGSFVVKLVQDPRN